MKIVPGKMLTSSPMCIYAVFTDWNQEGRSGVGAAVHSSLKRQHVISTLRQHTSFLLHIQSLCVAVDKRIEAHLVHSYENCTHSALHCFTLFRQQGEL